MGVVRVFLAEMGLHRPWKFGEQVCLVLSTGWSKSYTSYTMLGLQNGRDDDFTVLFLGQQMLITHKPRLARHNPQPTKTIMSKKLNRPNGYGSKTKHHKS